MDVIKIFNRPDVDAVELEILDVMMTKAQSYSDDSCKISVQQQRMIKFISDTDHYAHVLSHCKDVKHTLWIGTADIKDAYIDVKGEKVPFLKLMAQLIRKGVEIRLIHAKEPGPAFREDFDKHPVLYDRLERVMCPRVHFKMIVFDCQEVYIGSANLTGAGMGMKSENRRNFETGILTDNPEIVDAAMEEFDEFKTM